MEDQNVKDLIISLAIYKQYQFFQNISLNLSEKTDVYPGKKLNIPIPETLVTILLFLKFLKYEFVNCK